MRHHPRRARPVLATALVLVLAVTACGDDDGTETARDTGSTPSSDASETNETTEPDAVAPGSLEITAQDYAFDLSTDSLEAGTVTVDLTNGGTEDHQATVIGVPEGSDAEAVADALAAGDQAVLRDATFPGGPNGIAPGASGSATVTLETGDYVVVCFIPSPQDQIPHVSKGMVAGFTVADGDADADLPEADATVTISDGNFEVPDGFDGKGTVEVANQWDRPAELTIFRLQPGATQDDVLAVLSGDAAPGPPPFASAGGVTSLSPGGRATTELDLAPADYVFLSFQPDPTAGGAPQFVNGLITTVTVS